MSPSDRTGQRTAAEREAARQERERRRALRRGEPIAEHVGAESGAVQDAASGEPLAPAPEPAEPPVQDAVPERHAAAPAVRVVGVEARDAGSPETASGHAEAEQEALVGQATQAWEVSEHLEGDEEPAVQVRAPDPVRQPASAEPANAEAVQASTAGEGVQAPRRRASWRPRGEADRLPQPPPPVGGGDRQPPRRRATRAGGDGHSFRARAGAVGALAVVAVAVWVVVLLIQHFGGSKSGNAPAAARAPEVTVVVPEGEDRRQIAAIARKDGLRGDYLQASVASSALQPKRFGAPAGIPNLEGFLFPATYKMPVRGNVKGLVERQLEAFQERFGAEEQKHARALGLTSYQLLIVASMIEREAYLAKDRPLVAAVIYNRLHQGMALGIDSTIRFALNDFTKPLTEAQLQTPSPYNTRLHKGLPPTPISNPGMEAIEAAAHPAHVGYLYYVDGADGCGDLVFSDSEAEFEHNKAAYDEALAANGGRTPTCRRK